MNSAISADLLFKGFFLLTFCWAAFASVPSETGSLPPPSRLTLNFSSDFCVNLWWSPPENLSASAPDVRYLINGTTAQGGTRCTRNTSHRECLDTEDGVTYSVRAYLGRCEHGTGSSEVVVTVPPRTEKLVKDFECVYYTSGAMNCTWRPTDKARDLQLYYWYEFMPQALPCDHYLYSGRDKTGCHLYGDFLDFSSMKKIFFLFNETRGSSRRKNTFRVDPNLHMKPYPPNLSLNLTAEGHTLRLRCDPHAGFKASCWDCIYRYRSSGSADWQERYKSEDKPVDIPYDRRLQYHVQVKAVCKSICGTGSSDWSETQSFGEERSDWSLNVALIAIPVVVIVCVILFLFFFKRLRVWILPQIPDPMTLFKELVNSKEAGVAAGSHLTENAAVPHSKSPEKQMLYVPEEPELCVNVQVEEPDLAVTSP